MRIKLFIAALLTTLAMTSQNTGGNDSSDEYIRLNPELGAPTASADKVVRYPFIRYDLNRINMNGDDWTLLAEKLEQAHSIANFTIVHIGDSHIQADGNTGTTRKLLQQEYGDAGRGIIIPFRMARTNQPDDYKITSTSPFVTATLMRLPWPTRMGFTGVSLQPEKQRFSLNVEVKNSCGFFTILSHGDLTVEDVVSEGQPVPFSAEKNDDGVYVSLDSDCSKFTVEMSGNNVNIYGLDLRNDNSGVLYHAIGNNGASFASYNGINDFGSQLAALEPDLVIIALGTNDAFGRTVNPNVFRTQLESLVRKVKSGSPHAHVMLVTPSECQRSSTVSTRSKKGGKKRVKSYAVNTNVAQVRGLILDYGRKNNIPVYDFYAVAGGEGASDKWLENGLLGKDRIHRTWKGYHLDGTLMYLALKKALSTK